MIIIALGANLPSRFGGPEDTLAAAYAEMERRGVIITKSSAIWLTAPVPASDQPWYRNAVVSVETALDIFSLLQILKQIEKDFGRADTVRDAPRVLDLDVIAWNDRVYETPDLVVPHPRMQGRGFVLYPLQEIAPGWIHPVLGQSVAELIAALPEAQAVSPIGMRAA